MTEKDKKATRGRKQWTGAQHRDGVSAAGSAPQAQS